MKLVRWIQKIFASVLFIGYFPWMPGTIGSALVTFALWYLTYHAHYSPTPIQWWTGGIGLSAFSVIMASRPREVFHADDPKQVIIDECAGQFITFCFLPLSLNVLVLGFLLFRFYDIVKPFPIYKMEELEGGLGITMDDVMAGVFANISLMAVLFGYHVVKRAL
ncbi:MAG: phosphatidylglycerophosphatase A [Chitinivibrionales bacterium]